MKEVEIKDSTLGQGVLIGDYSIVTGSHLQDKVQLGRFNEIIHSDIGKYCYTGANTTIRNASLGKFNSVSWNVSIGGNNHEMDHITTHSFLVYPKFQLGGNSHWKSQELPCVVENDVWIAAGAHILRGVTIGSGAVIGANSVVTKDVPPYMIVAGNPAKIIRPRFPEDIIQQLLELKWWECSEDFIRQNFELFKAPLNKKILKQMFELKGRA